MRHPSIDRRPLSCSRSELLKSLILLFHCVKLEYIVRRSEKPTLLWVTIQNSQRFKVLWTSFWIYDSMNLRMEEPLLLQLTYQQWWQTEWKLFTFTRSPTELPINEWVNVNYLGSILHLCLPATVSFRPKLLERIIPTVLDCTVRCGSINELLGYQAFLLKGTSRVK